MEKRKVTFELPAQAADDGDEGADENGALDGQNGEETDVKLPFAKKFKHTLDSDEEDDEEKSEKYNVLDPNEFEGEEEGTARVDDEIKITAFNMKDELEEGHFDKDGAFVYDKKKNDITDSWLDNIDWVQLRDASGGATTSKEAEEAIEIEVDVGKCYSRMLELMTPGESVQRAIRRLGLSAKKGKVPKGKAPVADSDQQEQDRAQLLELTSLADQLLHTGDMDVYDKTYEQLAFKLKSASASTDIFADDDDGESSTNKSAVSADVPAVAWEFKWENKEGVPVFGPNSTEQMIKWVEDGYFESGVWVRQLGKSDAQFYNSKRVDFELYT